MVAFLKRRHFVPNPVVMHSTGSGAVRRKSLSIHTRYDGLNRLIEEYSVSGSAKTQTDYYYAGDQLLETRVARPSTWAGEGKAVDPGTAAVQYQYVWSPAYVDTPVLRDKYSAGQMVGTSGGASSPSAAGRIYYLTDANANVTAVADPAGNVLERYSYDAYGDVTVYDAKWETVSGNASAMGNTVLFGGMQQDSVTGLYYDSARWYDPATGGF